MDAIRSNETIIETAPEDRRGGSVRRQTAGEPWRNYFIAVIVCAAAAVIATPLREHMDLANIVMLFLLAVVVVAVTLGRGPAVLASFCSVAMLDYFFVPPRFSFTVEDPQYLLTFAVMLVVALVIGNLTAHLREQAADALAKEWRSHALYEMARELTGALTMDQVTEITRRSLRSAIAADSAFLLPDGAGRLTPFSSGIEDGARRFAPLMARLAFENAGCTDLDATHPVSYFPLKAPAGVRGVMAVVSPDTSAKSLYAHQELLQTAASLAGIAVERLYFADRHSPPRQS